jgi:transposase
MEIKSTHLGDLPVIMSLVRQSGISRHIDEHFSVHGHWVGPKFGKMVEGWLLYIISEADHRLYAVEEWAEAHLDVLRSLLEEPDLQPGHFSDDRLSLILDALSDEDKWPGMWSAHTRHLIQIFDLSRQTVRLDAFVANSFRPAEGLFQKGHSKQHRADLPQIKAMMAALDPLAFPVGIHVTSGEKADDPLYLPAFEQARQSLPREGMLYVGDTKLGSLGNREAIARSKNYYLSPMSLLQFPEESLWQGVKAALADTGGSLRPVKVLRKEEPETVAHVYELASVERSGEADEGFAWTERLLLGRSEALSKQQSKSLNERIEKALEALRERSVPRQGRKIFRSVAEAEEFAGGVLRQFQVEGCIELSYEEHHQERVKRAYGQRPAQTLTEVSATFQAKCNESAIERRQSLCGWCAYATNAPKELFSAEQLVECYRQEYCIEHKFHQLLNKTTAFKPIFLSKENRVLALLRLTLIALQVVTLVQHKVRKALSKSKKEFKGVVPGNPGRKVPQPTAEQILRAFTYVILTQVREPTGGVTYTLTGFKEVHRHILDLMDIPVEAYTHLSVSFQRT